MAQFISFGDFMTQGEERTALYLRDNLPDSWSVVANKIVSLPNGIVREIDFIVIGKNRLFILDEKGFGGKIHGSDSFWMLESRETRENPLNKMEMVARKIAGYLRDNVQTLAENLGNAPFVDALIVLSEPSAQYMVQEPRRERIVRLEDDCKQTLERLDKKHDCSMSVLVRVRSFPGGGRKAYRLRHNSPTDYSYRSASAGLGGIADGSGGFRAQEAV